MAGLVRFRMRSRVLAVGVALVAALALSVPAVATARVYVGDSNAGGGTGCPDGHCGAIFSVPSAGGDGTVLVPGAPGGVVQNPAGLVPAGDGALFAGDSGADSIVRINRDTGVAHPFVSGSKLADIRELGRTGDALYYLTYSDNLFRVDLATKAVRKVNSKSLTSPSGVAVAGGHAYVSNQYSDIYDVNLGTGHVRYLVKQSPKWSLGGELKLSPDHKLLYLAAGSDSIMRIRIRDGAVHKEADVAGTPLSLAVRPGGGFLVGNNYYGYVNEVKANGNVSVFSDNPLYQYPTAGIVIGP